MPLVKAIASSSCIKKSDVITVWTHVIITRYNVKEKDIRIKKTKHKTKREQIKENAYTFFLEC